MAGKPDFTDHEWSTLLMSPTIAGMAITAADPSGLWGTLKEAFAAGSALEAAKTDDSANDLIKSVAADLGGDKGLKTVTETLRESMAGVQPSEVVDWSLKRLREAARIVDATAPQDAPAFKAWLASIAQGVAEASKEGGFLGFGGVQVSDTERVTLTEIRKALSLRDEADPPIPHSI
ncbi:MAG: hypothetical protein AAF405_01210 [Pseudomonadota bacterium]